MKNSIRLTKLALSLAAPALCIWLLAGRDCSLDLLFGAYALSGLFFLTTLEYAPRPALGGLPTKARANWIRASIFPNARTSAGRRSGKISA
jgi:hypothetical protein